MKIIMHHRFGNVAFHWRFFCMMYASKTQTKRFSAVIQNFTALSASWLLANALLTFGFYFIGFFIFVYDLCLFWQVLLLLLVWLSIFIAKLRLTSAAKIVADGGAVVNSLNRQCLSAITHSCPTIHWLFCLRHPAHTFVHMYGHVIVLEMFDDCGIIRQPTTIALAWLDFGVWLTFANLFRYECASISSELGFDVDIYVCLFVFVSLL